jgi:hypothetical protein
MLYHFVWKTPSWLYFLSVGDVFVLLGRALFSTLLESLSFMALLLGVCFVLPAKFMRTKFILRASALTLSLLAWIVYFESIASLIVPPAIILIVWSALVALTVPAIVYLAGRFPVVERVFVWLDDRLIVFLYLTIPTSLISGALIFIRSLIGAGE